MKVIKSQNIIHIIMRTLGKVDGRLMGHGERVAFMTVRALRQQGAPEKEILECAMLAVLHDIGAYKTEDIDQMVQFESHNVWEHSVYGYLFIKNFTPLKDRASSILYHHMPYYQYKEIASDATQHPLAGLLNLIDRVDILLQNRGLAFCHTYIKENSGYLFDPYWADILLKADEETDMLRAVAEGSYQEALEDYLEQILLSEDEKKQYLMTIAYSIDFRSEFMVLHTITTVTVSRTIAELFGIEGRELEEIYYGALLHDVGKVATPVSILEKPGRLTPEEMDIMRLHVVETGNILEGLINPAIYKIAVRHHEKLNGGGYPLGLKGEELSRAERIVAIADILSALIRRRSYKDAYDKEKTIAILTQMKQDNQICPVVTDMALANFDKIVASSAAYGSRVLKLYEGMQLDYQQILKQLGEKLGVSEAALAI